MIFRHAETARQAGEVDLLGEVLLDEIDDSVQNCDHSFLLPHQVCPEPPASHPTIAVRFDRAPLRCGVVVLVAVTPIFLA